MNLLVVGGAGYIGSHMIRLLDQQGHQVTVLDNLTTGFAPAVTAGRLIIGDLLDKKLTTTILKEDKIEGVMHFAACAQVGESVTDPAKYYQNNVVAALNLLECMRECDVKKIVFSSTCATYGVPNVVPITEKESQEPVNPYGFTKLVIENALRDYAKAYDFGYAALRYFNAAGASPDGAIGEDHEPETHLIPIVLQVALGQREHITVFGDDYPTPDGTCIRDYIHVNDLGMAHLAALERLQPGKGIEVNLGTGVGHSVRQVIDVCRQVTGHPIPEVMGERREGDPPELIADARMANKVLEWQPQMGDLETIVKTAWQWHQANPNGYEKGKPQTATN